MIKIRRWDNGDIIHSGDFESIKECLENAIKHGIDCRYADLINAILTGASLYRASLYRASLDDANLNGANLDDAILNGASLNGASLDDASLYRASLYRASLYRASLDDANLNGANLNGANLDDAILNGASLDDAILDGASLYRASLSSTIKIRSKKRAYYKGSMFYCWFFGNIIKIGCRVHYYNEWKSFTDEQILKAENQEILDFWNKEKHIILAISKSLQ